LENFTLPDSIIPVFNIQAVSTRKQQKTSLLLPRSRNEVKRFRENCEKNAKKWKKTFIFENILYIHALSLFYQGGGIEVYYPFGETLISI
tara:strand:+ start:32 stop:301 length:270 start_codon:yes stop_codon:yes gene_type:complete